MSNIEDFYHELSHYGQLVTDSRSVYDPQDTIFAAIRTDIGDGHRYIPDLYARGVRAFIVEERPEGFDDALFVTVDNVRKALRTLGQMRMDGRRNGIIVTGSIGKTTVKELLYTALLLRENVRRSPRSWNSGIGVPLALWDMTAHDEGDVRHYITEVGIDAPLQGVLHARLLGPSHNMAVITPITDEHDEAFASHADKIREKLEIALCCDVIVYADTDPELGGMIREIYPEKRAVAVADTGDYPTIFHALTAAALRELGYTDISDVAALNTVNKRREIAAGSFGNTVYRDYFTPDFRSLADALDFMRRHATPSRRKTLIAGRILDGGPDCEARVRELAAHFGIDTVAMIDRDLLESIHRGDTFRDMQILLFGMPDETFTQVAEALESAGHETTLEVDLDALAHNYNHYRSLVPPGTGIVAMVKASAYGVGSIEVGKTLQSLGAAYLAVAVIEEGIALREAGITMPVMVLNPVTNRYPALFAHRLEPAVFSPEELDRLIAEAEAYGTEGYPVHIKLDTGMHRVGFTEQQLAGIAERLNSTHAVRMESVFSHLATADCLDLDEYTRSQIDAFRRMTDSIARMTDTPFKRHLLNTAGMMRFADMGGYEMARLGIGLYGISPSDGIDGTALRPVASFRSHIISLKHWPAGTPIGYGCNGHTVAEDSVIATVPVGYADGILRRLGRGNASFIVGGKACPTIGNICMDLCMIDVTGVTDVKVGDTVEIFGPGQPVERLADILGTIPYEVLTSVSPRVKRVYVKR